MPQEKNIRVTHGRPMTPTSSSGKGAGGLGVSAGGGSYYSGFEHGGFDTGEAQVAITVAGTAEETQRDYQARSQQLLNTIEYELAATRLEGSTLPLPPVETINRELAVREKLLARKTAELQRQTALAHLFFGADPLGKPKSEFYRKAQAMEKPIKPKGAAIQSWTASYKAAHEAKLLSQTISVLNQQQAELLKRLAAVQAQEQAENARKAAEAEAKRALEERARLAAQAQRLAAAEKAAALAKAQAEAKRVAAEAARMAADAEAKRAAEERARLAAEAQRLAAAEKAAAQAKARARARRVAAQKARIAAEAQRTAQEQALRNVLASRAFPMLGAAAATGPVFTLVGSSLVISSEATLAIQAALRAAVAMAVESLTAVAAPTLAGVAALLYSPKLANGELPERYAFSTPLSDLAPTPHSDLQAIAAAGGTVDLPVRLTSQATADGQSEILVINTDGVTHPSKVRVLPVTYNAQQNLYTATTEDTPPRTLTWTPVVQPGNSSTALPAEPPTPPAYTGASVTPAVGRIDPFPEITQNSFDDYVFVFPIDSGLPPLYVMFRDRRKDPGIATGTGAPVLGVWTDAASKGEGAPIPSQIADQLRGKGFGNFKEFREALWKAVADDPILSQQFNLRNRARMKNGRSAYVRKTEKIGGRTKYELHHKHFISLNGQVYDIDNMTLTTPKRHIEIHRECKQ